MNEWIDGGRGDVSVAVAAVMRICLAVLGFFFSTVFFWFVLRLSATQNASFFSDNGSLEDGRKKAEG